MVGVLCVRLRRGGKAFGVNTEERKSLVSDSSLAQPAASPVRFASIGHVHAGFFSPDAFVDVFVTWQVSEGK